MSDQIYYEVIGGKPLDFCREWRTRCKSIESQYLGHAESKGGVGFVRRGRDTFGGIVFKEKTPEGWKEHRTPCRDGTYFCKPIKRGTGSAEGKVAQAEIDALPRLPSDDEFCELFGFPSQLNYEKEGSKGFAGFGFHHAQIAWVNSDTDSFWVVLPDVAARVTELQEKGYVVEPSAWVEPEGIKRSSRSRYELAVAADKVATEERDHA